MALQNTLKGVSPKDLHVWGYKVLVKVKEASEMTAGGIILSSQTTDKENLTSEEGTVLSLGDFAFCVGSGQDTVILEGSPNVGDQVLFNSFAGTLVTLEEGLFRIILDSEVVGVIHKKNKEVNSASRT